MFAICESLRRPTSAHLLNSLQPASECHYGSFLLLALCTLVLSGMYYGATSYVG